MEFNFLNNDELAVLKMRGLFEEQGYKKYKVSRFEEYKLYLENQSFLPDKHVITFTDLDGKLLALKPDATLSIIKNTNPSYDAPEKLYYSENIYRVNKESRTFREINQIGLEYMGRIGNNEAAEVLSLAAKSLSVISSSCVLAVSHMGLITSLISEVTDDPTVAKQILNLISKKNSHELSTLADEVGFDARKLTDFISVHGDFEDAIDKLTDISDSPEYLAAVNELRILSEGYTASDCRFIIDVTVVNDAEFYNGILFRGYIAGVPRPILSGGRYDNVMKKMGKNADAIGFAIYLNELERSLENA